MSYSCFTDRSARPTPQDIEAALGPSFPRWQRLLRFIEDYYQMPAELTCGGIKYGWSLWYRKSGKSLVTLYPQQDGFFAQVVLGRLEVEKAMQLELGPVVGGLLRNTPQLHDGKWLFIPVHSDRDEQDVEQLLLVKKRPVKRKDPAPA